MYEPDTILKLKEPRSKGTPPVGTPARGKEGAKDYVPASPDYVPASEDFELFPYDRVKVVGQSPINHGVADASWEGPQGQGVIVTPLTDFGSTLDEPYGKLQAMYEVESIPTREAYIESPVKVVTPGTAGPTPEEVFSKEAPGVVSPDGRRGRTPRSPLGDGPKVPGAGGPLGEAELRDDKGEPQAP